ASLLGLGVLLAARRRRNLTTGLSGVIGRITFHDLPAPPTERSAGLFLAVSGSNPAIPSTLTRSSRTLKSMKDRAEKVVVTVLP
ncbi:MAG: hypothetical protein K2Q20_11480, partial [Phycisphaerales bacterium]|nr:hypothetical protein [Phycisphaerales bacterium]